MAVFVLDQQHRPLMPCSEKRARLLLARRRAVVHRRVPFVIKYLVLLQRQDGYEYGQARAAAGQGYPLPCSDKERLLPPHD